MDLAISVRVVQQALTQIARTIPSARTVAPRRIDGVWGPDTRGALTTFLSTQHSTTVMSEQSRMLLGQRLQSPGFAPERAHTIMLPDVLVSEFMRQANAYVRGLPAGVDVPSGGAERPAVVQRTDDGAPTVLVPGGGGGRGPSPALSIALGLGAAVLIVGGGYWLMTR